MLNVITSSKSQAKKVDSFGCPLMFLEKLDSDSVDDEL